MGTVGLTPSMTVVAENLRDLQSWSSHGRRRYGAGGSALSRFARRRRGARNLQGALDLGNQSDCHATVAGCRLGLGMSEQRC